MDFIAQKEDSRFTDCASHNFLIMSHSSAISEKNRIKQIESQNKKFNPNFHQAMSEIEDDKIESGTILQEIQAGYMLGDRLLRPALVSVSKKKLSKDQENKDKKEE